MFTPLHGIFDTSEEYLTPCVEYLGTSVEFHTSMEYLTTCVEYSSTSVEYLRPSVEHLTLPWNVYPPPPWNI